MDGVHYVVDREAQCLGGGESFLLILSAGGVEFDAVVAELLEDGKFLV